VKPFLAFAESAVVLSSMTILFLLFVIVQFRYFFGGRINIGAAGFTYSEYARRGFSELIIVAFISLVVILGLSTVTRRETDRQRWIFSGLSIAIVVLVIVILVSAYQRLNLAIDWHGFSRLRLYPRVFLIWIGILLVAVIVLETLRRERYFALAAVLAAIGFAISLSLINVDASIVRRNVLRATQGRHFNVNYLTSLSTDAVPTLVEAFMNPSLDVTTHEAIGAALVCFQQSESTPRASDLDWRSFDYSRWAALRALDQVRNSLTGYGVNTNRWPAEVSTPSHVFYDCAR
jgi:hypothetical protein